MDKDKYLSKEHQVLSNFSVQFLEKAKHSPIVNYICLSLINGCPSNSLLEEITTRLEELEKEYINYKSNGPQPIYIITTEERLRQLKQENNGTI